MGGSIIVTDLQTAVEAIDVIVVKQDYVSFFFHSLLKKTLLTFIIILFTLEMSVAPHKRGPSDVVHLLATGNVFFFHTGIFYI